MLLRRHRRGRGARRGRRLAAGLGPGPGRTPPTPRRAAADASAMARADAAGLRAERAGLLERVDELAEQHDRAVQRLRRAESEAAAAQAALRSEREAGAQREQLLLRRDAELKQAFQALSADALARNNEQFVALAEGRIKEAAAALHAKADGDAAARAHAIAQLLDPMAATLQRVEGQLRTVEKERESAYAGLREQVSAMRSQLGAAARRDQAAGQRAARAAGPGPLGRAAAGADRAAGRHGRALRLLHPGHRRTARSGGVRPDMVVRLAGGKQVVVDAKVPFAAYLEAVESQRPGRARRAARRARPPAAPARRRAGRQELLGRVRAVARVRGAVRARRPVPGGRAAGRPGAAGARVRAATSWSPRRPR